METTETELGGGSRRRLCPQSTEPRPLWEWFRTDAWLPLAQVGATDPRRVAATARRLGLAPSWVGLRRAYTWPDLQLVIAELRQQQEVGR
jgi:hypothetical protein